MITGFTSHKLDIVNTYNKTNPFQVGVNGVTHIEYNPNNLTAITKVYYTIDNIDYITNYDNQRIGISSRVPSINQVKNVTQFKTTKSGYDFDTYFLVKDEAKMGLVFPPKVINELFIERMEVSVFERQSRLSEIETLDALEEYRNGYYNIIIK